MKRRDFIGIGAAAASALILSQSNSWATVGNQTGATRIVDLGKSGLKVSRVGMGTGAHGWMRRSNQTRMGVKELHALIRYAYDAGIRYFDTADLYGSHPDIMPALKGIPRDNFVLTSKIWWREGGLPERERLDADVLVDRFLKEIDTEYIDLLLLHCVTDGDWNLKLRKQMDLLEKCKEQGKIRAHGVSVHALPALETATSENWVDSVHTRINPFGLHMDGKVEEVLPVIQKIHSNGKGVTGMKIIGNGDIKNEPDKIEESVRYVLNLDCVDTVIVGFEAQAEIDDFLKRVEKAEKKS